MKEGEVIFERGEVILREGEGGNVAYLVIDGQVAIYTGEKGARKKLAVITNGGVFGEMALIDPAPRIANAAAVTRTRCMRITRTVLERALDAGPPLTRYLLQSFIRNIRTASGVSFVKAPMEPEPAELIVSERSNRVLHRRAYGHGDIIFRQDSEGNAAYLIQSGEVDLMREDASGQSILIRRLGAGEVFGEMALLDAQPRYATAVARNGATLEILRSDNFNTLLADAPPIVRALMRIYAGMIRSQAPRQATPAAPAAEPASDTDIPQD